MVYAHRVPRFDVYEYVGPDHRDFHWFKARADGSMLGKSMESITADTQEGTFKPFLLDMRVMTARFDESE
jgi:hypothetical protein